MNFRLARVCALLFFSGASALVYQTAWLRELRLIFGSSTAASAAVLAIFMGGLGLGGALLGRRADRVKNALELYANLELLVSVAAGLTPLLVKLAQTAYVATGGVTTLGAFGATAVRILLSVVVLAPATILMGGTLPAAARAVERASDVGRQRVAALYGVNTFGAVAGAVAANFLLVEVFGARMTLWIACLVNALVGMAARSLSRSPEPDAPAEGVAEAEAAPAEVASAAADGARSLAWFPPMAAAISGGTFMLMELVWYRMLGPILGGSSFTFGLILAVALAGIGLGGAMYARTRVKPSLALFAITCAVEALVIAIPYALGDRLAMLALLLRPLCNTGFGAAVLAWAIVATIVVLPGAVVSGAQFPLVIGLYGTGSRGIGRDVGAAYLANTLGAIVGAIAGGFGLLPALSAPGCWRLVVGLLVATAALALALDFRARGKEAILQRSGASAVACGLAAALFVATLGPTAAWRHSGIGAGRADARIAEVSPSTLPMFQRTFRGAIAWEEDGLESSVALNHDDGYSFIVNGKSDGHAITDGPTQVMGGMLGGLLHPEPRRAMVIGLGTGSTAGWLGSIQGMERVDVVELEPAILRVARDCHTVNRDVLDNPKVHTSLGDAREALLTTRATYDIIFSEPSNPYRAGISSLYTVEFYKAAAERLNPHGIFMQWVQGYEIDAWCLATTMVTLKQVFKNLTVWRMMGGDLLVVAQNDPAVIDVERMRRRLGEEAYASAAKSVWRTASVEGVLSHFVANPNLAEAMLKYELGVVNHDDQNVLEFAYARSVGNRHSIEADIVGLAARLHANVPAVTAAIDPVLVFEERWLFQVADGRRLDPPVGAAPPAERELGAFLELHSAGQFPGAVAAWKKLERKPRGYFEGMLLGEAAANVDEPEMLTYLDALESQGHRELTRALLAARRGDLPAAVELLVHGFELHRKDPWIRPSVTKLSLDLAFDLARRTGKPAAIKLYDALGPAFAAETLRSDRLVTRSKIGAVIDMRHCADALHELEPAPYVVELMRLRLTCYEQTNDPLTPLARDDVARLTEWQGTFAAGLELPSEGPAASGPARPPRGLGEADAGRGGVRGDGGAEAGAEPRLEDAGPSGDASRDGARR